MLFLYVQNLYNCKLKHNMDRNGFMNLFSPKPSLKQVDEVMDLLYIGLCYSVTIRMVIGL